MANQNIQTRQEIEQRIKVLDQTISKLPTREKLLETKKKADGKGISEEMTAFMELIWALHERQLVQCEKTVLESVLK